MAQNRARFRRGKELDASGAYFHGDAPRAKYGNKKIVIDGIKFDSTKEAERYWHLRQLERAGLIEQLALQPRFELQASFRYDGNLERSVAYVADFSYIEGGRLVVEDVKGFRTPVYLLKRKLFLAKYGHKLTFREL